MNQKEEKNKNIDKYLFPNRSDEIYKNIENFEDFEFTHSIVYEFARRNKNVQHVVNFLNDLFTIYENFIYKSMDIYYKYLLKNEFKEDENIEKAKELIEQAIKKHVYEIIKFHKQEDLKKELEGLSVNNVKEKLYKIVKLLTDKLYIDYYIIYTTEYPLLFKHINEIYNPNENLEHDKILIEQVNKLDLDNCDYNIKHNDFFYIFQIIHKKNLKLNTIYPKYKTSIRDFTDTKVALNLNLPKKEIIDFIEKIKDNYDKKSSIIKTPLELFGEKLEIDLEDIERKNKWADLFFIYDYYNVGIENKKKKSDIENEIQLIFTKIYGVKIMKNDIEIDKSKKFDLIPYKEYLKKSKIKESDLDLNDTAEEKHYYTTRSIRSKYKEIKDYIKEKNPKYKTLIYK